MWSRKLAFSNVYFWWHACKVSKHLKVETCKQISQSKTLFTHLIYASQSPRWLPISHTAYIHALLESPSTMYQDWIYMTNRTWSKWQCSFCLGFLDYSLRSSSVPWGHSSSHVLRNWGLQPAAIPNVPAMGVNHLKVDPTAPVKLSGDCGPG